MKIRKTVSLHYVLWTVVVVTAFAPPLAAQQNWQASVGAETPGMGRQALAFLPNEMWIHAGDSVTWSFNSDEIHTVSFLVVGQPFPPFPVGCPGFSVGAASFDGSTCVTTPPFVKGGPAFTVTFPAAGNFRLQCLVHNTMNGTIHVLDASASLPYNQAFYDKQAQDEQRALLTDNDHAMSSDLDAAAMAHSGNMVSIRVLAAKQRIHDGNQKPSSSSGANMAATAHVKAGVGEIVSTTGGVQTSSLVRFVSGKIVVHVGDTVEWDNNDPQEPHTMTFGPEPQDLFDPSSNVTMDLDGGLHATLNSPTDSVHSGFILQPLPDQPGTPVNSTPNNSLALNPTIFRVTFMGAGTYNYKCALHDNLGMVGQVSVLP